MQIYLVITRSVDGAVITGHCRGSDRLRGAVVGRVARQRPHIPETQGISASNKLLPMLILNCHEGGMNISFNDAETLVTSHD